MGIITLYDDYDKLYVLYHYFIHTSIYLVFIQKALTFSVFIWIGWCTVSDYYVTDY